MRKLKVFGGTLDGVARYVVFAYGFRHAADVIASNTTHSPSVYFLRGYWSETGNRDEIALCNEPSVWRSPSLLGAKYTRMERKAEGRDAVTGRY
jgi:hypothetical protein